MLVGFLGELQRPGRARSLVNSLGGPKHARELPRRPGRSTSRRKAEPVGRLAAPPADQPLRILDSKERARPAGRGQDAPTLHDFLGDDDQRALRRRSARHLDALGHAVHGRPRLVRGPRLLHAHALRDQRRAREARRRQHAARRRPLRPHGRRARGAAGAGHRLRGGPRAPAHRQRARGARGNVVDALVAPLGQEASGAALALGARAPPERHPLRGGHARRVAQEPAAAGQRARGARGAHPGRRRDRHRARCR